MSVDRRDDRALYLQLADVLRDDITTGRLAPGDRLPSESELIGRHDISRGTVRDAIAILRSEGLVVVEHGRGAFVRTTDQVLLRRTTDPESTPLPFRDTFERDVIAQGHQPSVRELDTARGKARDVAAGLDFPPATEIDRTGLVCFIDGRPVQTATVWRPRAARSQSGTGMTEELTARMPSRAERRLLQLDDGAPVIDLTRTLYNQDVVLEIAQAVLVADRHILAYTATIRGRRADSRN